MAHGGQTFDPILFCLRQGGAPSLEFGPGAALSLKRITYRCARSPYGILDRARHASHNVDGTLGRHYLVVGFLTRRGEWPECRDDLIKQFENGTGISILGQLLQPRKRLVEKMWFASPTRLNTHYFFHRRLAYGLVHSYEFLAKLFSRAKSNNGNGDFFIGNKAAEANQIPS